MFSIGTPALWIAFAIFVVIALFVDFFALSKQGAHKVSMREAIIWTVIWLIVPFIFVGGLWWYLEGHNGDTVAHTKAMDFISGYLVERALAVDNIFVFILLFSYFGVAPQFQKSALMIGILVALVLRAILIVIGSWLISQFHWILYGFGVFLVYTGIKMARGGGEETDISQNPLLIFIRKHLTVSPNYDGQKIFTRVNGVRMATPMLVVVIAIGIIDVVFAVDSIPAIFAITTDPFVVLTSNVFAILGLRALYFVLAGMQEKFHLLAYGLAIVLSFIGIKMLLMDIFPIPTSWSLVFTVIVLAVTMTLSVLIPPEGKGRKRKIVGCFVCILGDVHNDILQRQPGEGYVMASSTVEFRKIHGMSGEVFPALKSRREAKACELPAATVAEFHERGFIKGPRVLNDHQVDVLREGLERIRKGENPRLAELYEIDEAWKSAPEQNVFHFLGAWRIDEAFHDVLFNPLITVPVSQLLGSPQVRFWHDQVFYKPPRHPGVVAWHQDYSYWTRSIPARHLTVWIGLDDTTVDNGCIHYVPGSHKWPLLPKLQLLENMDGIQTVLTEEQKSQFKPEPMLIKAGECSIHDSLTLHGSYGNASDGPRRGVVLNYLHPATVCADGKHPLLLHTPIIPEGSVIEGDDFPIVYDDTKLA